MFFKVSVSFQTLLHVQPTNVNVWFQLLLLSNSLTIFGPVGCKGQVCLFSRQLENITSHCGFNLILLWLYCTLYYFNLL